MRSITTLVIHHSATPGGDLERIAAEHASRKPAIRPIGYHGLIGNGRGMGDGEFRQGRPDSQIGAAVAGRNTGKLSVCLVGNLEESPPTRAQLETLGRWLLEKNAAYAPKGKLLAVLGHREAASSDHPTACPGKLLPLDRIRTWFQHAAKAPKAVGLLSDYLLSPALPPGTVLLRDSTGREVAKLKTPDVLLKDGRTYVLLRVLAEAVDWECEAVGGSVVVTVA